MALLVEAEATAGVQEAVFFAVANLLNLDVEVILFDTTRRGRPGSGPGQHARVSPGGHSKDHRQETCRRSSWGLP